MKSESFKLEIEGKTLEVEINNLAERANASVWVKLDNTVIIATCVMSKKEIEGIDFFPLSVAYEEKYYAVGKILGSRFLKRESRPSEKAILNSRLIDRAIRPLFPSNLKREVQVITTCVSWDKENDPSILSLFAASLALSISDIPWNGPIAPLRIGKKDNKFNIFTTPNERQENGFDLTISSLKSESEKELIINMIEAEFKEAKEDEIIEAIKETKDVQEKLINFQKEITKKIGKEKQQLKEFIKNEDLEKDLKEFLGDRLKNSFLKKDCTFEEIKEELKVYLTEKYEEKDALHYGLSFFEKQGEELLHEMGIDKDIRIDGRNSQQLREIECKVNLFERTHGSGLFCRGQTKVLSFLTLGSPGDQKIMEEMEINGKKRFMHHYNFPPSCVGETGPLRGPGRREIGHGMLAEKALRSVIPESQDFPYTIRLVSEVLCSNGSSSMASTCAACLALMDGGVPIKKPVSGIAMGLMMETSESKSTEEKKYKVLTDVQGEEDHYGDMDFKVAGTKDGINALQMDLKVRGITDKIIVETLTQSKKARLEILDKMLAIIPEPRNSLSPFAPRIYIIKINPEKIGEVIGTGGKVINEIIDECNVLIDIEETGEIFITAEKEDSAKKALEWINNITREVTVGEIFQGNVKRILDFGAFVEILPGQEGLVHISQLSEKRVEKVGDVVKTGDIIPVKVISIDEQGRINLSLKEARKNNQ
ncbi:MAG: polyribonucleotide nucleotidyltransferase [Candidatus Pacebacteria bacterium]|nr:polyribonucleotide nucleotidyltransferase [Candidatus Paceibacterota bacterium]MDD5013188.1 polyribonucleotide nucleotidyltransferase [Candidatus Paceibacterota bacterium]MDD5752670.1 polyribonucleotide nucleotidyltransferase [Candidatus Paceibacterota bacterium]